MKRVSTTFTVATSPCFAFSSEGSVEGWVQYITSSIFCCRLRRRKGGRGVMRRDVGRRERQKWPITQLRKRLFPWQPVALKPRCIRWRSTHPHTPNLWRGRSTRSGRSLLTYRNTPRRYRTSLSQNNTSSSCTPNWCPLLCRIMTFGGDTFTIFTV